MKHSKNVQLYVEPDNTRSENISFSEKANEMIYLPELYSGSKPGQMPCQTDDFYGVNPVEKKIKPGTTLFPVTKAGTCSFESPVKIMNSGNAVSRPFINVYLKETAARLSDIELAIDNYDGFMFQCAIHSLIDLFINMKMPAAVRITRQMEELASENKLQEVLDLMLEIKKIIAQLVKSMGHIKT